MEPRSAGAPRIIAHRGYSEKAPENTLAAVRAAVEAGADGVEWDMATAACGTPILLHDRGLGRTTNGVGPVRRRTLTQLKALDAGSWFGPEFQGEQIPSLEEACRLINDLGFEGPLLAEIKGWRELEDVDRMVQTIQAEGLGERARFISIDWSTIDRVLRLFPDSRVAFVVEQENRFEAGLEKAKEHPGAGLAVDYRLMLEEPGRTQAAEEAGVAIGVWTVDDPDAAAALLRLGIRDLTTNRVGALLRWRSELG